MEHTLMPLIPTEFMNSDTGGPFSNCLVCSCQLMHEQQPYVIERAIRQYPQMGLQSVVFEYALCATCIADLENELSVETRMAIMNYFNQNFNRSSRPQWVPEVDGEQMPFHVGEWIDVCAIKGLPRTELQEYTLCARCIGDRIIPDMLPYMISGEAQDEMIELFSNHSLGFLDDFTDRYFSGPPELKELFKGRPILL